MHRPRPPYWQISKFYIFDKFSSSNLNERAPAPTIFTYASWLYIGDFKRKPTMIQPELSGKLLKLHILLLRNAYFIQDHPLTVNECRIVTIWPILIVFSYKWGSDTHSHLQKRRAELLPFPQWFISIAHVWWHLLLRSNRGQGCSSGAWVQDLTGFRHRHHRLLSDRWPAGGLLSTRSYNKGLSASNNRCLIALCILLKSQSSFCIIRPW